MYMLFQLALQQLFKSLALLPNQTGGSSSLLSSAYQWIFFWGVWQLECEVDCTPPASVQVKNACSYTFIFMARFLIQRENLQNLHNNSVFLIQVLDFGLSPMKCLLEP